MQIQAFAAKQAKSQLSLFHYQEPELGPFDLLLEVTHCGLCHSDIHLIDNDWNRSTYPLVPGHEVVGIVRKKGGSAEHNIGDRVGVSWLYSSCLNCPTCFEGNNQLCPQKKTTCLGHYGGFANLMTADSRFAFALPKALDSAIAAPLLCAGATVYAPLRRLGVQAPHKVAVIGIGGLGHVALQFANAFGAEVTAISSTPEKKADALSFGASHFFTLDELSKHPTSHLLSFDYILSTVHVDLNWNLILSFLKPCGTLCFLGRPSAPLQLDVVSVLSTQRSVTGSSTANRALMNEMLSFSVRHQIAPKIELMQMSDINKAIEKVRQNKVRYRIVLTP